MITFLVVGTCLAFCVWLVCSEIHEMFKRPSSVAFTSATDRAANRQEAYAGELSGTALEDRKFPRLFTRAGRDHSRRHRQP